MRKFVKVSAIIAVILILPICGLMAVYGGDDEDDLYDDYYGY